MKSLSLVTSVLLATCASARLDLFGSTSEVLPLGSSLKVPGDNPLEHCSDPAEDVLAIKSVNLYPNPPEAGKNLTIIANGVLAKNVVRGAVVHLTVKYGLITLIRETVDLCEAVKKVDLECPLKKGPIELVKEVSIPAHIPSGQYHTKAEVKMDDDEEVITCLQASPQFGRSLSFFKQDM